MTPHRRAPFHLGKKHCQLVAAFTRAGHISSVIFGLDFKTTPENRLKGKPRNSTWIAEKWNIPDYNPVPQNTRASGEKQGWLLSYLLPEQFRKTGWSLLPEQTERSMSTGWSFPFLTFALCSRTLPAILTAHPPPSAEKYSCVILETYSHVICSWATDRADNFVLLLQKTTTNKHFNQVARAWTASPTQGIDLAMQNVECIRLQDQHSKEEGCSKKESFCFFMIQ